MNIREKVLIVEDEKGISQFIAAALSSRGYEAIQAHTGGEALTIISSHCPDLVILDLGLPDMDGLAILEQLRAWSSLPVVVVSARSHEKDKVTALDLGADDYLTKPFGTDELLARVRAVLRRTEKTPQEQQWQVGPLYVCPQRRQVQVNGQDVLLTYKEFEILSLLLQQQGRVMTREMLMDRVWGLEADRENRTLDVHIRTLRQKLGEAGHLIETVRGVGYKIGGRA